MSQSRIFDRIFATGTTNSGSTITLLSSTPPNDINTIALGWVLALAAGDERAAWTRLAYIHKTGAGVLTLDIEEDLVTSFATNGIKHSSINVIVSGGTISLDVTGDPAWLFDILWQAEIWYSRS